MMKFMEWSLQTHFFKTHEESSQNDKSLERNRLTTLQICLLIMESSLFMKSNFKKMIKGIFISLFFRVYFPILRKDKKDNTIVYLKRVFPKCEMNEFTLLQGDTEEEIKEDMIQERDYYTEQGSDIESTDIYEESKLERLNKFSSTPQPVKVKDPSGKMLFYVI